MRIPKRYGQSTNQKCPFCDEPATTKGKQKLPVCRKHVSNILEKKCVCGEWLEVRDGKFGVYFNCMHCGNIPLKKGMS
jgi:hypothetical protein